MQNSSALGKYKKLRVELCKSLESLKTKYETYVKSYNKDLKEWETKKANLEEKEKTETGKLLSKGGINAPKSEELAIRPP